MSCRFSLEIVISWKVFLLPVLVVAERLLLQWCFCCAVVVFLQCQVDVIVL